MLCKSCGATIWWRKTAAGRSMPVDVKPVPDGNVFFVDQVAHVVSKDLGAPAGAPLYKSHFATCPAAARHWVRT